MNGNSRTPLSRPSTVLLVVIAGGLLVAISLAIAVAITPVSWSLVLAILLVGIGAKLLVDELRWWLS